MTLSIETVYSQCTLPLASGACSGGNGAISDCQGYAIANESWWFSGTATNVNLKSFRLPGITDQFCFSRKISQGFLLKPSPYLLKYRNI